MSFQTPHLTSILNRRLILVHGKGGVGKTTVSKAIARALAEKGHKTLWICLENPIMPTGEFLEVGPRLYEYNAEPFASFEEFVSMKLKVNALVKLFIDNQLVKFLARSAPGIPGLVMLGKILYETQKYDRVVVDMPATGHALMMYRATQNFSKLFVGGLVSADAGKMLTQLGDPSFTGSITLGIPEEMPLQEALEFEGKWQDFFPENPSCFIANKIFPQNANGGTEKTDDLFVQSVEQYIVRRQQLETRNLKLWHDSLNAFEKWEYLLHPAELYHFILKNYLGSSA